MEPSPEAGCDLDPLEHQVEREQAAMESGPEAGCGVVVLAQPEPERGAAMEPGPEAGCDPSLQVPNSARGLLQWSPARKPGATCSAGRGWSTNPSRCNGARPGGRVRQALGDRRSWRCPGCNGAGPEAGCDGDGLRLLLVVEQAAMEPCPEAGCDALAARITSPAKLLQSSPARRPGATVSFNGWSMRSS